MLVKMKKCAAGPSGVANAGELVAIDDAVGRQWIELGVAEAAVPDPRRVPVKIERATAAVAEKAIGGPQRVAAPDKAEPPRKSAAPKAEG